MPMVFDETRRYDAPVDVLFRASLTIVQTMRLELKRVDEKNAIIEARKGASMWTWGEHIRIAIQPFQPGASVFVESAVKYQMIDYGRNRKNVLAIFEELDRRVAALGPTATRPPARQCSSCGAPVSPEAIFCQKCGAKLGQPQDRTCPACQASLQEGALFCERCGAKIARDI